jgi:outer membrane protein OmpA-like peptidoglycan-associated protein
LNWKFYHRGRSDKPDEMELNIYSDKGVKVATLQKASTNNSNWKEYSGYYKIDFPTGTYQLSFEAIRTGSGNSTVGNFVDGISIELSPLLQFASENFNGFEASSKNVPRLILNGTVPHGGSVVTINVEGGNAIFREDYLFPGSFTVPAGIYTPSNYLIIPLSIMNDNIPEGNEWLKLTLVSATAGVKLMDADCDGSFYSSTTYTIIDDDTANRPSQPTAVFNNKKISTSDTVTLKILFEQGTDITTKSSDEELLELLRFMEKNPKAEIELEGHTEKDESAYTKRQRELNMILSERRVKKIKNYLIGKGISGGRIKTVAYGGTKPISDDPAKNRRVVMRVLKL